MPATNGCKQCKERVKTNRHRSGIQDARTTTTTRTSTHSYSIRPAWCSRAIVARCAYGQNHALRNRSFGTVLEDVPIEVCCRRTVDDGVVLLFIGRQAEGGCAARVAGHRRRCRLCSLAGRSLSLPIPPSLSLSLSISLFQYNLIVV